MAVKYYCDCCQKKIEIEELYVFEYRQLTHVSYDKTSMISQHKDLCSRCYNDIIRKAIERFEENRENYKEVNP